MIKSAVIVAGVKSRLTCGLSSLQLAYNHSYITGQEGAHIGGGVGVVLLQVPSHPDHHAIWLKEKGRQGRGMLQSDCQSSCSPCHEP